MYWVERPFDGRDKYVVRSSGVRDHTSSGYIVVGPRGEKELVSGEMVGSTEQEATQKFLQQTRERIRRRVATLRGALHTYIDACEDLNLRCDAARTMLEDNNRREQELVEELEGQCSGWP